MDAKLLEQAIYEHGLLSKQEAGERAYLIFALLKRVKGLDLSDHWISLSDNWDINIYSTEGSFYSETFTKMSIYPVIEYYTDTSNPVVLIP